MLFCINDFHDLLAGFYLVQLHIPTYLAPQRCLRGKERTMTGDGYEFSGMGFSQPSEGLLHGVLSRRESVSLYSHDPFILILADAV